MNQPDVGGIHDRELFGVRPPGPEPDTGPYEGELEPPRLVRASGKEGIKF